LTAKAGDDPLASAGAKLAADELRQQTDQKANGIISEATRRADSLIAQARRKAQR
jgi:cell division septum initiation protein DivIVA